jgi:hypothetical protein
MRNAAERPRKSTNAMMNTCRGVNVQWRSEALREFLKWNLLTVQMSRNARFLRAVNKSRGSLEGVLHVRGVVLPFTLIATTV